MNSYLKSTRKLLLLLIFSCYFFVAKGQVNYTWNGSTSTSWNTVTNWTPNGLPGSLDNVTIVTGANNCNLAANTSVNNITFTSGTFNLGGFVFSVSGNAIFTSGTANNGTITVVSTVSNFVTLAGTVFNSGTALNVVAGAITVNGGTYGGRVTLEQTGSTQTTGNGNATFNGITIITNSGTSNIRTNGNITFNGVTTLNNTGTGYILLELGSGNTYNSTLNLNNSSASNNIRCVYAGTTNFNGNIIVSNTGVGSIVFGEQASSIANLNAGFTIASGGLGFTAGSLQLNRFRQNGATAQTISLSGTAGIAIQNASIFNGALDVSAPTISGMSTSTFNAAVSISKTGAGGNPTSGGNVFNSTLTVNNTSTSSGYLGFGNGTRDIFNGDLYLNNTSNGERIIIGQNSSNNQINGNVYVTSNGTAQGIDIGLGGTAPVVIFAPGKIVSHTAGSYSAGYLRLYRTQQSDATPLLLSTTGTSRVILQDNVFTGSVTVTSPDIYPYGGTYNAPVFFTKTGGTSNHNNTILNNFNSTLRIDQQSNSGYFMLGYNSADLYADDITLSSSGTGGIYFGWTNGVGTPSLAAGKTILTGAGGFTAGFLQLNNFRQLGNAPMNFTFTGDNTSLFFANNTLINGVLTCSVPNIYFNGAVFNNSITCIRTSSVNNTCVGGNTFNATCSFTNEGTGHLIFANNTADTWNSDAEFSTTGSSRIGLAWASAGNVFNGNITMNSTGSATGVHFCGGSSLATATLVSGKSIQIGNAGFTSGNLILQRFTQLGTLPVSFNLAPTANYFSIGPNSTINGNFSVTAPAINNMFQSVFNGSVTCVKTGTTNDACSGGNTFNGACTFTNSGSGYLILGNGNPDVWNSDVEFTNAGSERILPCWNSAGNLFAGDITVNSTGSSTGINFCGGSTAATATLAAGKTIQVGSVGFSNGYLILQRFTQLGSAPITLSLSPTANYFSIGPNSTIGGNFSVTAPSINNINQSVFGGSFVGLKTGSINDACTGGNVFNGPFTFTNNGSGFVYFGNGLSDTWNSDVEFTSNGSSRISPCWNSAGNLFAGNISVNSLGSSVGFDFCGGSAAATATLASGKTIQIGSAGFSSGYLLLRRFTQLGSAPITLSLSPTSNYFSIGPNSSIGGNFTVTAPSINSVNQSTFNGSSDFTKTGANNDAWTGGNLYVGASSFSNIGAGYMGMGWTLPDTFNDVTFTNAGSERILPGWVAPGNLFLGNITVNSYSNSVGVSFCGSTGTATMSAGKTVSVGTLGFSSGYLILRRFTQLGNAAVSLSLSPTASFIQYGPNSAFGGDVSSSSPGLLFNGATFSGSVTATKFGASNDWGSGTNVFNGPTVISQTGSGYLVMGNGNPDQFNGKTEFNNLGSANMHIAYNSGGNVFGGRVRFNNLPTSTGAVMFVGSFSVNNSTFNDSIVVSNVNGGGVQFGSNSGTSTLSAGNTISIGTYGFDSGTLLLRQFIQLGATAQSFTTTGSSLIQFGPSCAFDGNLRTASPRLLFNGGTYNGSVTCTKNGAGNDSGSGQDIFNGAVVMSNSGSGHLMFGNSIADQFNSSSTFNNTGTSHIYVAWNSAGNVFGGPVTLNNTPASISSFINVAGNVVNNSVFSGNITVNNVGGAGISFGSANGTSTLSSGNTISVGTMGFNTGYLTLRNFTQTGVTQQSLTTTGSSYIQYGPACSFDGNIISTSPGLLFNGGVYNNTVIATKNGPSNDAGAGGNIFNGPLTITSSGAGQFYTANGSPDQYNSTSIFNNTGSGNMYIANNSAGNVFGGRVRFNNTPSFNAAILYVANLNANNATFNDSIVVNCVNGAGVQFGASAGGSTLSAGKLITVGPSGFNLGTLLLRGFVQVGATNQSLTTTGSSFIQYGPASSFGGNVTSTSPGLFFNGCTFSGSTTCTKTGPTSDSGAGANVFNGPALMTNSGSGHLMFGNSTNDQFNSSSTFNNTGTSHIYVAWNSAGNVFGGPVTLNNTPGSPSSFINMAGNIVNNSIFSSNIIVNNVNGAGISFGSGNGTSTLSAGNTISVGSLGYNSGYLILRNFTQTGVTQQSLTTTGSSYIQYGPACSFDGNIISTSPGLLFSGGVFNGTVNATKNGPTNDSSPGNNTFNNVSSFTNNGSGFLSFANSTADTYNSDVAFVQNSSGLINPNQNTNCTYAGNISVTSPAGVPIVFGASNGTAEFIGSAAQSISRTVGTALPTFRRLTMTKTSNTLTLNTRINVSVLLTLNSGIVNTSSVNLLVMNNGAATTVGNANSYINGPMLYDMALNGTRTLNFPIGKNSDWRPASITVNHNSGTSYSYYSEVFNASAQALGWTLPATVSRVSFVHYWDIDRQLTSTGAPAPSTNLSGNQGITLYYGNNDGVGDPSNLVVCKNTTAGPTTWINIGGAGATMSVGSVASTSSPSSFNSFSRFTLGNASGGNNVLPIELVSFTAKPFDGDVALNWITSTEKNNDYFDVERSQDGLVFEKVFKMKSAKDGNSVEKQNYEGIDPNPFSGLSYYRLKQVDKSGKYSYAPIVSVIMNGNSTIQIYPNPVNDRLILKTNSGSESTEVSMVGSLGNLVLPFTTLNALNNGIDVSQFAPGVYYLVFRNDSGLSPVKVVVQR